MHKVKLIASDLDGTLLLNGAQKLQSNTCEIIEQLIERGIYFIAASGRQYPNLLELFSPIKDKIGYICENGCMSYLNGELISQETMSRELGQEIIKAIIDNGCEVFVSGKSTCYIQSDRRDFAQLMMETVHYHVTLVDDIFNTPEEYMKISAYDINGHKNADYFKERFSNRCTVQISGAEWLDNMPKGVNKSTAFSKILKHLNIDAKDCIMFGDNDNDIEILSMVGCPIVMNSAKKEIQECGRYTIDRVEEALLRILNGDEFNW